MYDKYFNIYLHSKFLVTGLFEHLKNTANFIDWYRDIN